MGTLAILDGHSLAYRAFYALPEELVTSSGQTTNAALGFVRMLIRLLADHSPDKVAVAWDVSRKTFRTDLNPEYKAQRSKSPETFKSQVPLIQEFLGAMGITQMKLDDYEADDLIGSLATAASGDGWDVLIVSGDRDSFQLINDQVKVLYPLRGISESVVADAGYVEKKYGLNPSAYVEFAALRGDTSDNLPGVPRVGDKTAAKLLNAYGSLEGIFEHLDELTPALRSSLSEHRERALLNRQMMTLVTDLAVPNVETLGWRDWNLDELKQMIETLEFHSLWKDLSALHPDLVQEVEQLDVEATVAVSSASVAAAVSLNPLTIFPLWQDGEVDSLAVMGPDGPVLIPSELLPTAFGVLEDSSHGLVGHDLKPIVLSLGQQGTALAGIVFDTMLAEYVINPASRGFSLSEVAERRLGLALEASGDEPAKAQGSLNFDALDGPDLSWVGASVQAIELLMAEQRSLVADQNANQVLEDIEFPLITVLAGMEQEGIGVDTDYLRALGETLRAEIAELEVGIHADAGGPFNVNSTLQLREILFERLELPVVKKTSKGVPSTDASVLEKLKDAHPMVGKLLRYRELEKLRGTYIDGYLPLVGEDGRMHTTFHQTGSATGRLSSDRPNLQNIPARSDSGRLIRKAFVARPGWSFIVADYSQIELRILADMSGDERLTAAFLAGIDIHAATAASVFDVPVDDVTPEHRRRAKAINFGLLYGMEAYGLASRLEISRDEAAEHIEAYFARFSDVKAFMESIVEAARKDGYTETIFGRRRYFPELRSDNWRVRQMGERAALNAPIQGGAADVVKLAMIRLDPMLAATNGVSLLQIHDELVVEAPLDEVAQVSALLRSAMEGVAELSVPLVVDLSTGLNLDECKG